MLEYNGSREDFAAHVRDMLPALEVGDRIRGEIREAALGIYRTPDWEAIRTLNVDRLFLRWLIGPDGGWTPEYPPPWLYSRPSVDHYLPPSQLEVAHVSAGEAMKARDKRVERTIAMLRDGWGDEAIVFVAAKEEWLAARIVVGKA